MNNMLRFSCIICIAVFLSSCARQHQLALVGNYKRSAAFFEQKKTDDIRVAEPDQVLQPTAQTLTAVALPEEQPLQLVKPEHQFMHPVPVEQQAGHIKSSQERKMQVDEAPMFSRQEAKKALKTAVRQTNQTGAVSKVLLIILCILLPPLAVGLAKGIGWPFWLSLILTICFWIPGVIYALIVILGD